MTLHTASEIISFIRLRENDIAEFYEKLCRFGKNCEELRRFARESRRDVVLVQQAYNNVISDALESGFAFDIEAHDFEPALPTDVSFPEAIKGALETETTITRLYSVAAEQSWSLLGDVARAMRTIAHKRQARIAKLLDIMVR